MILQLMVDILKNRDESVFNASMVTLHSMGMDRLCKYYCITHI